VLEQAKKWLAKGIASLGGEDESKSEFHNIVLAFEKPLLGESVK
jgi:hypothetical protein